jgi:aspartyl-tRNA(Asn)/glutamyl-tRNA(Gln) amidotransferase subunit C
MEVDKELLKKVANTARLKLTNEEIDIFLPQMKEILEYFKLLQELDTEDVEPSFQPIELKNWFREDKPENCLTQEEALMNSTQNQDKYFKGPKAV